MYPLARTSFCSGFRVVFFDSNCYCVFNKRTIERTLTWPSQSGQGLPSYLPLPVSRTHFSRLLSLLFPASRRPLSESSWEEPSMVRASLLAVHDAVASGGHLSPVAVVVFAVAATVAVAAITAFGCAQGAKKKPPRQNNVVYYGKGYPPPPAGAYGYPAQQPPPGYGYAYPQQQQSAGRPARSGLGSVSLECAKFVHKIFYIV
ncbi:uncharacterized protein LOC120642028 [Panicum virgatum]|uniref:uncharacterized protein LOC120642028 n=1 Tax=Panicum virgatum TaxID=38727 RepID=UPI0019D4FC24|nr:uncharacterized protein LOC120642028 [Panicum virgatum]